MIGSRTRSREIALQVLFAVDVETSAETVRDTLADAECSAEVRDFAGQLVDGVRAHTDELDALIATAADNWEIGRLAAVDRCVLRLAVYELLHRKDIPPKVSINEAIELGKRFSTAQSGSFINGILDRVRKDLGVAVDDAEFGADLDTGLDDHGEPVREVRPGVDPPPDGATTGGASGGEVTR